MGKKKSAAKKRAPIQQAKLNATTNDIKGRTLAFQEVSLLKDIKKAPNSRGKGYNIPRHAFLQSMAKDEMKYPHPDLFFPGEMKFRNTFGRFDPVRKKLPPLSQILRRELHAVEEQTNLREAAESQPSRQLSTEEARFLNYSEAEKVKRGGRGEDAIFDSKMLQEMDYETDDEEEDEVSERLTIPFHRSVSKTRNREGNLHGGRNDTLSTRGSSVNSMFSRQSSQHSLASRQGSQRSLNSNGSYSTYDPMQQYQNPHNHQNRGRSESVGSHASYSSYDSSPNTRRAVSSVPAAGYPTIRDLYGDSVGSSSGQDMLDDSGQASIVRKAMDLGEIEEYDDNDDDKDSLSLRSESTTSFTVQQLMDPLANIQPPVARHRKLITEHNEEAEYDNDGHVSDSESIDSFLSNSSFASTISYLEDSGRPSQGRSSSSHTSFPSDGRLVRSDSDASFFSNQSDEYSLSVHESTHGSIGSDDVRYGVSTIPEEATFNLHNDDGFHQHNTSVLYSAGAKATDDAAAALYGLEPGNAEPQPKAKSVRHGTSSNAPSTFAPAKLPYGESSPKDDYFGLLKGDPVSALLPVPPGMKRRSHSTIVVQESRAALEDRRSSFTTFTHTKRKVRLPHGVAQLPSWWVNTVPHRVIEEHSADESEGTSGSRQIASKERLTPKVDVTREASSLHQGKEVGCPAPDAGSISPLVQAPTKDIYTSDSSESRFIKPLLAYSTSTELTSIEQSVGLSDYRPEVPNPESIIDNQQEGQANNGADSSETKTLETKAAILESPSKKNSIDAAAVVTATAIATTTETEIDSSIEKNDATISDTPLDADLSEIKNTSELSADRSEVHISDVTPHADIMERKSRNVSSTEESSSCVPDAVRGDDLEKKSPRQKSSLGRSNARVVDDTPGADPLAKILRNELSVDQRNEHITKAIPDADSSETQSKNESAIVQSHACTKDAVPGADQVGVKETPINESKTASTAVVATTAKSEFNGTEMETTVEDHTKGAVVPDIFADPIVSNETKIKTFSEPNETDMTVENIGDASPKATETNAETCINLKKTTGIVKVTDAGIGDATIPIPTNHSSMADPSGQTGATQQETQERTIEPETKQFLMSEQRSIEQGNIDTGIALSVRVTGVDGIADDTAVVCSIDDHHFAEAPMNNGDIMKDDNYIMVQAHVKALEATTNAFQVDGNPSQIGDGQALIPSRCHGSNDRSEKEKRAEDLFATIVGGPKGAKQEVSVKAESPEKAKIVPNEADKILFTPTTRKFAFFGEPEPDEIELLASEADDIMKEMQQIVQEVFDDNPSLAVGPTDNYDDLDQRWQEAGDINDEGSDADSIEMGSTFKEKSGSKQVDELLAAIDPKENVLSLENVKKFVEDMDASDNMDSQLADSSGKSSNRWIIKSSEWKATHQGQKKKAEMRPRRNSIGRRIMGGFQEEAREAHQRKEDAIRPVADKEPPMAIKKAPSIRFTSNRKKKKEEENMRRGLRQRSKSENNGGKKTPWFRGFMLWKNQTSERFGGGQQANERKDEEESISVHSENGDTAPGAGVNKLWRQDLGHSRPQRRNSWSASSNASLSGDDSDFFDAGGPIRRTLKRRGSRGSKVSNVGSMDIDEFLNNEGMPIDLIGDIPKENLKEGTETKELSLNEHTPMLDSSSTEQLSLSQRELSLSSNSGLDASSAAKPLPAFLRAKSDADQSEREQARETRRKELEKVDDCDSEDDLDVFKELTVVAETIQSARGTLKAEKEISEMPVLEAHSTNEHPPLEHYPVEASLVPLAAHPSPEKIVEVRARSIPESVAVEKNVSVPPVQKVSSGGHIFSGSEMQPGAEVIHADQTDPYQYDIDPNMGDMLVALKSDNDDDVATSGDGIMIENMKDVVQSLKDVSSKPRRKMIRRGSIDTLENWEPPIGLEERRKQREFQQPNAKKVEKWKSMISRPKKNDLFRKKKNHLDDLNDDDTTQVPPTEADSSSTHNNRLGAKSHRTALSSSEHNKSSEKYPDEMASKASSKNLSSQSSSDGVAVKSQDLPPLFDAAVDDDSTFASNTSDDDAKEERIALMERDQELSRQRKAMKEVLNEHRRRSFSDDFGSFDDDNFSVQSDFSDEIPELGTRESIIAEMLDDESTVVSYLNEEEEEKEEEVDEEECEGPSALTLFLASVIV